MALVKVGIPFYKLNGIDCSQSPSNISHYKSKAYSVLRTSKLPDFHPLEGQA